MFALFCCVNCGIAGCKFLLKKLGFGAFILLTLFGIGAGNGLIGTIVGGGATTFNLGTPLPFFPISVSSLLSSGIDRCIGVLFLIEGFGCTG